MKDNTRGERNGGNITQEDDAREGAQEEANEDEGVDAGVDETREIEHGPRSECEQEDGDENEDGFARVRCGQAVLRFGRLVLLLLLVEHGGVKRAERGREM